MKKITITLSMVLFTTMTFAQQLPGSGDSAFAKNGLGTYDLIGGSELITGAAIDKTGFIWMAGDAGQDILVSRLQPEGDIDPTFANNGTLIIDLSNAIDRVQSIAMLPSGDAIIAGYTDVNGTRDLLVTRIRKDGSVDPDFADNGYFILDISGKEDFGRSVIVDSDGKIVIAGHSTTNNTTDYFAVRLNDTGTVDSSFNVDGVSLFDAANAHNVAIKIIEHPTTGDYYLFGNNQTENKVMVYAISSNGNGKLAFNGKSFFQYQQENFITQLTDGMIDHEGNILLLGGFQGATNYDGVVVRFKPNGNLDLSFNSTGYNIFTYTPANLGQENHISFYMQDDSMILISGSHDPNGAEDFMYTIRLKKDGTKDPFYGNGNGFHVVALDPDHTTLQHTQMIPTEEEDRMLLIGRMTMNAEVNSYVYAFNRVQHVPASGGGGNTGINKLNRKFKVYPNPASTQIFLDVALYENTPYTIRNLQGAEVQSGRTSGKIDLNSSLQNGIYFLSFEHEGMAYVTRLIINN